MAAGATYTPIATITASGSTTSVTFSSIPSTYTDIVIIANVVNAAGGDNGLCMQFNNDTGSNYSTTFMYGTGTSAVSNRQTSATFSMFGRSSSSNPTTSIGNVQNYANTTTYKTTIGRGNNASALTIANISLWRSTSAINSITILNESSQTITSNSIFTLYGILSA